MSSNVSNLPTFNLQNISDLSNDVQIFLEFNQRAINLDPLKEVNINAFHSIFRVRENGATIINKSIIASLFGIQCNSQGMQNGRQFSKVVVNSMKNFFVPIYLSSHFAWEVPGVDANGSILSSSMRNVRSVRENRYTITISPHEVPIHNLASTAIQTKSLRPQVLERQRIHNLKSERVLQSNEISKFTPFSKPRINPTSSQRQSHLMNQKLGINNGNPSA